MGEGWEEDSGKWPAAGVRAQKCEGSKKAGGGWVGTAGVGWQLRKQCWWEGEEGRAWW